MKKTDISIIIPVKSASIDLLPACLDSLYNQTFKNFEVIVVTDYNKQLQFLKKHPLNKRIKVIAGKYTKTQARNTGAKKAKGSYLLHIDADYKLHSSILKMSKDTIKKFNSKAIILHEIIAPSGNIWQKARQLERELAYDDIVLSAPQMIEKELFQKIGGFDERVDALDDWALSLKLARIGVIAHRLPPLTVVHEPTNFFRIWRHRFHKGRYYPLLKKLYISVPQTRMIPRLGLYLSKIPICVKKPHVTLALILLKFADTIPFIFGTLFPVGMSSNEDMYQEIKTAEAFDTENSLSNIALYKHYTESNSLLSLLRNNRETILELGAGTGRITELLTANGWRIFPTDISKAMLTQLEQKKHLPHPRLITGQTLPFKNRAFDHVIAIRVIWHILNEKKRENFFREAVRASKKSVIMDFTHNAKYSNPFIRYILLKINPAFFIQSHYFSEREIYALARKYHVAIENIIALEVLPPLWLNGLPESIAKKIFPYWRLVELLMRYLIPPGRLLIQFKHI